MQTKSIFAIVVLAFSLCLAQPALAWTHADNVAYVSALYNDLARRNATNEEVAVFVTALDDGTPRSNVVRKMLVSSAARRIEINILYERYLTRTATPLESGGSATLQETALSILASPEYYKLKGGTRASFIKGLYVDLLGRLPTSNDTLLIAFEHGDMQRPYVVGAVFNGVEAKRRLADSYCQLYLHTPCGTAVAGIAESLDDILVAILSSNQYAALHRGANLEIRKAPSVHMVTPSPR